MVKHKWQHIPGGNIDGAIYDMADKMEKDSLRIKIEAKNLDGNDIRQKELITVCIDDNDSIQNDNKIKPI